MIVVVLNLSSLNMSRDTGVDILNGVRRYAHSLSRARLCLAGVGLLLFITSLPMDILRHHYVWTSTMDKQQEEADAYSGLIGHCECFERDAQGHLPACVRAYSTVWSLTTVLQFLLLFLLLLSSECSHMLRLLCGAYVATVCNLFVLFIDCGALTEDDCFLMYLLLPLLVYSIGLICFITSSRTSSSSGTRKSICLL